MDEIGRIDGRETSIKPPPALHSRRQREARARGYRVRAEELLAISEDVLRDETRVTLRGIAENYEFMASALENLNGLDV
jgi:hypothetical protein